MMAHTRRDFLTYTAAAGAAFSAPSLVRSALGAGSAKKLKILFLGGTGFVGPHFINMALEHGHEVTLLNRGNRAELFPDLELIIANRIADEGPGMAPLQELIDAGRTWDVVIDTASVHQWVDLSAGMLKDAASHYVYVSSLSAYADTSEGRDETDAVATMPDDIADSIDRLPYDMTYYGAVKARCEAAAEKHFGASAVTVRPGLIVGPRDTTHRFSYWPLRVREGGRVLAPGSATDPVMFIDGRDVAKFMLVCAEKKLSGIYNVNGPAEGGMTIGKLLDSCRGVTGSDTTFTWVDADFLAERGVNPWSQMPVWIPPVGAYAGFHKTALDKAVTAGLTTRPLDVTIRETLAWYDEWAAETKEEHGWERQPGVNAPGVSAETEASVLADWDARDE